MPMTENKDDTRSFPVQGDYERNPAKPSTIPWWLAELAYEHYAELFGRQQSLERLGERGGFGRDELVKLLKRENPCHHGKSENPNAHIKSKAHAEIDP